MSACSSNFHSPLAPHINAFLVHHRGLGKRFDTEQSALQLLDRYLTEHKVKSLKHVTSQVLEGFLLSRPRARPKSFNHLLNVLHRLFGWMVTQQRISQSPLHVRPRRSAKPLSPFLFDCAQVQQILELAAKLADPAPLRHRAHTYRMIYALMYGVGLRVGEVSRLSRMDVDFDRCILTVNQTKFAKTRFVPFGPRMGQALQAYVRVRHPAGLGAFDGPLFSVTDDGRKPLGSHAISHIFNKLVGQLELPIPPGVSAPRLHCLRHSFAVSTLLRWYRTGIDPGAHLFHLSVFLGHVNPASTAVYLNITSELLQEASQRFRASTMRVTQELDS